MNRRQIIKELYALATEWERDELENVALSKTVSEFGASWFRGKAGEDKKHAAEIRKLLKVARNA